VRIANFAYQPTPIHVKAGGAVTFTNGDSTAHTATADSGSAFDTGSLSQGASKAITLTKPGTYTFHCAFHAFMHGTVVVG
jgi:plastocyanin